MCLEEWNRVLVFKLHGERQTGVGVVLSTWRKTVADSVLGILTRVLSTYRNHVPLFQFVLYMAHENISR